MEHIVVNHLNTDTSLGKWSRRLLPYLSIGLFCCLCAQVIFWLELGGPGLLLWPFLWAYSQEAMIGFMTGTKNVGVQAVAWAASYLALSALLWLGIEEWARHIEGSTWKRALLGWVGTQLFLALLAWGLFTLSLLDME